MTSRPVASYLRTHRRKAGLSQSELASILGLVTELQISRHERSLTLPLLLTAISYEIVFQVPLAEMFPGIYETVRLNVETRLDEIEERLKQSSAKGRKAAFIARKLEWLWERRNPGAADLA
ncbi:MAG: helix-turn-helix domain-containing protein [Sulfobacillus sp.]